MNVSVKKFPSRDQMEAILHLLGETLLFCANSGRAYPRPDRYCYAYNGGRVSPCVRRRLFQSIAQGTQDMSRR